MDWNDIDRLRDPRFTVVRRGYDKREVDRLLGSLVDWLETDAATDIGELAIKRKLEHVGKASARILLTTEEEAQKLRRMTQDDCSGMRAKAEEASLKTRAAADEYAAKVRAKADEDADRAREAARTEAKRQIDEAERRRAEIDAAVGELQSRREGTIKELDRLRGELASTLGTHQPEPPPAPATAPAKRANANGAGEARKPAKKSGSAVKA